MTYRVNAFAKHKMRLEYNKAMEQCWKQKYIKIFAIISLLLVCVCCGIIDYWVSTSQRQKDFDLNLEYIKNSKLKSFNIELKRVLKINSYNKIKSKLQFLSDVEIIKAQDMYSSTKLILLDRNFLEIGTGSEILLFSLNDIYKKIRATISSEVAFDLSSSPVNKYHLSKHMILIPGKLYLNYGIKNFVWKEVKHNILVDSAIKTLILFVLLVIANICFLKFYRSKEKIALSKGLFKIKEEHYKLSSNYKKLKSENTLINLIFLEERRREENKGVDISNLCRVLREFFSNNDFNINFQNHITSLIGTTILEKDLYLICSSILFYKVNLSKDADFKVLFDMNADDLSIYIEDNGFILPESKMIGYSENTKKPDFILEWWQVLLKIEQNNIRFTQGNKNKINFIKLEIPSKETIIKNNVISLEELRKSKNKLLC